MQISSFETIERFADVRAVVRALETGDASFAAAKGLFDSHHPLVLSRAPGRLDVMGGIADYSGSLVLEMPIREAAIVILQRRADRRLRIVSATGDPHREALFETTLDAFEAQQQPVAYADARALFAREPRHHWAAYLAGAFLVLMREHGSRFGQGANILLASAVPEGKGVSSSAAIEVATMQAIAGVYGIDLPAPLLAMYCQKVENLVVGAPCGLMDQMTSACGEAGGLLALLCQPADIRNTVAIPSEIEFWGIDSGVRHRVSGADYGDVRVGAFMGYRIIAELAGLNVSPGRLGHVQIADPHWGGYLANLTPAEFESRFRDHLPERISGREFLDRYHGTTDPVTTVDPDRSYAVRQPTAHPVYENARVGRFAELLVEGVCGDAQLAELGELMYASHAGYSACGLDSEGTDLLVELVRQAGSDAGLHGAKITGGGSGGTVAVLARRGREASIQAVARAYAGQTGRKPYLFSGSSPGAARFGTVALDR